MLKIKVFTGPDADQSEEFEADYFSLISDESYGPPALIAPKDGRAPTAKAGETVLYINTRFVALFTATRLEDDA